MLSRLPLTLALALLASLAAVASPAGGASALPPPARFRAVVPADVTDPIGEWPLRPAPQVVRGFEPPDTVYGPGHRGVDLAGRPGQPVLAALPGVVSFAGVLAGRGVVVVDHGPTRTTYEPVVAGVAVGDPVLAGDRIGTLTLVQSHCAPAACLHWGWRRGEGYLDPLRLVGGGPVRLLPLWRDLPVADPRLPAGASAAGPGAHAGSSVTGPRPGRTAPSAFPLPGWFATWLSLGLR